MTEIMEEKRRFERFDLAIPARLSIEERDAGTNETCLVTRDICAGGAFLQTTDPLPEGTRVRMNFAISIEKLRQLLDSECQVRVNGVVVRSEKAGIAIRFEENYEILSVDAQMH